MRLFFVILITIVFSFSFFSCVSTVRATPAKVVVINKLPETHKIVSINGHRYYYWNNNHYKKTRKGYVLVVI